MSIARAIVQGRPTGELRGGPVAELITLAKRDLSEGDQLDGGGGYTVYGMSEQADVA
jgi:predicted homoserine dehydrogenase-like protein